MHFCVRSSLCLILSIAWLSFAPDLRAAAEEPADAVVVSDQSDELTPQETNEGGSPDLQRGAEPDRSYDPLNEQAPASLPSEATRCEPFEFDGIQPGSSTLADVHQVWGKPLQTREQAGASVLVYEREPFKQVEVSFSSDQVSLIVVQLTERFAATEVANQLQLVDYDPVLIYDGAEICRGQAYPERGVVLRWATIGKTPEDASEAQVAEVAFGCIEPHYFLLRAEARFARQDRAALADIDYVLEQDPQSSAALGLKAKYLWRAGRYDDAIHTVSSAMKADPKSPEHRLLYARLLADAGDHQQALDETKRAISLSNAAAVTRARGLVQLGELTAGGDEPDYYQPIELYQQAIKLSESMLGDSHPSVRRGAGDALIDAHLAMAYSIAWGRWKMKPLAVGKWLDRASALAAEIETSDESASMAELRVCQGALAACAGAQGKVDPSSWAERASQIGSEEFAKLRDPFCRQRVSWQLGLAFHDALQAFQARQQLDAALKYGELAADYFEQGAVGRQVANDENYMLGRFHFRLGSLYAMHRGQHQTAVACYDKALAILEQQASPSANVSQQGEMFVTAAISYWNERQRDKAVALTSRGIKLLEQAAAQGEIEKALLSVPYANLAAMHEQLGDRVQAASYAEQASSLDNGSAARR